MNDIKLFISDKLKYKSNSSSSNSLVAENAYSDELIHATKKINEMHARRTELNNPDSDREILSKIDEAYFNDNADFDASLYELEKLPPTLDVNEIKKDRCRIRSQCAVVTKRVSDLILESHPSYSAELQKVTELQLALRLAHNSCINARSLLQSAQENSTVASLKVLACHRKKQILCTVLKALRSIDTMQETDIRLRELLADANYPEAVQLCLECQQAVISFKQFDCISELDLKLQDTLSSIEVQLDAALATTCSTYQPDTYSKLMAAYQLLNKSQAAVDQHLLQFSTTISNTSHSVLCRFVQPVSAPAELANYQYSELCKLLSTEAFIPCLKELCRSLWQILFSYHSVVKWHEDHRAWQFPSCSFDDSDPVDPPGTINPASSPAVEEAIVIRRRLCQGLVRVWQESVQKVNVLVATAELAGYKFDNFMVILQIVDSFIKIGEKHFLNDSDQLRESLRQQSSSYFKHYHKNRMEELRLFLEAEGWTLCPVKQRFSYQQLTEFSFMKEQSPQPDSFASAEVEPDTGLTRKFVYLIDFDNPFDNFTDGPSDVMIMDIPTHSDEDSGNDSDTAEDVKGDYIDELTGRAVTASGGNAVNPRSPFKRSISYKTISKMAPILSNTTLSVLRLFGKYLHMVNMLMPVAYEVVYCLTQLFDFYLYVVFQFFGKDMANAGPPVMTAKLGASLRQIEENLICPQNQPMSSADLKFRLPQVSTVVNFSFSDQLFALSERIVAVESVLYLGLQLESLRSHLESVIPDVKKPFLQQFFTHMVAVAPDLRCPVYSCVASKALNYAHLLQEITNVNWEIRELMSQHNAYVDFLIKDFEVLSLRLSEVSNHAPVPKECYELIWNASVHHANKVLIEGYACARRCTSEGRALMQLDYQQLITKLEKITVVRPLPGREMVEGYIKAYYLPETAIEQWVMERREYTNKQLISLLNVATHISKRTRQRLVTMLEDSNQGAAQSAGSQSLS